MSWVFPREGERRPEQQASGSALSRGGRPGVLSGDPSQVAARTPGLRPSPDSPTGAHDWGPVPGTRSGRSPRSVAMPFPRLQGLQEIPQPVGQPLHTPEKLGIAIVLETRSRLSWRGADRGRPGTESELQNEPPLIKRKARRDQESKEKDKRKETAGISGGKGFGM